MTHMRKKILLVEDDEATRGLLSTLLERTGYDVVATDSVQEGKSLLDPSETNRAASSPEDLVGAFEKPAMNGEAPLRPAQPLSLGF